MKIIITEEQKKKLFIPRKLSKDNHRWMDHNKSQPIKDGKRINQYDENGLKQGYWEHYDDDVLNWKGNYVDNIRQGYWEDYHDNGQLYTKGNYKDGEREGYREYYYDNGKLFSKGNFINDNKDGYWEFYYMTGELMSKGNYINGEKVKNLTESEKKKLFIPRKLSKDNHRWMDHNNSQPIVDGVRINQYDENGLKQGYWEHYYYGRLWIKGSYVNGVEEGYWEEYYNNGNIYSKGSYVNGKREGYWEYYYSHGQLHYKGNYVDGDKVGYWESYFRNGDLESKGMYKNGKYINDLNETKEPKKKLFIPRKLSKDDSRYDEWNKSQPIVDGERINQYDYDGLKQGYWEDYYPNGELALKGNYIDGKKDGYWEEYYRNGKLSTKLNYKDGKMDGYFESYWGNDKLESRGYVKDDKMYGYWEFYFPDGEELFKGDYADYILRK